MASVDSRLIDTSQMAREGSAIFIRSQQVRDQTPGTGQVSQGKSTTERGTKSVQRRGKV